MSIIRNTEFEIDHTFDPANNRHRLNGDCTVLHCHHYATLYTQLALDAVDFEGVKHLTETAEDVFYGVLEKYFTEKCVVDVAAKLELARQYWQASGMGVITFTGVGKYELTAEMDYSHIDEGWLKKWGGADQPVNFFTVGFVAAVAALANNKPVKSFKAVETKSIACGDEKSEFKAVLG